MDTMWPKDVLDFEAFLASMGLILRRRENEVSSGYRAIQYADSTIAVKLELDRTVWSVEIADVAAAPDVWYEANLMPCLVFGRAFRSMSWRAEIGFVRANWLAIRDSFAGPRRGQTHARLTAIRRERAIEVFPSWPDAVLDLEVFLKNQGLTCRFRKAPAGPFGSRSLQYTNSNIGVRVVLRDELPSPRWCLEIADISSRPSAWYDLDLVQHLLEWPVKRKLAYADRYKFLKVNWAEIARRFSPSEQEDTHMRLALCG